MPTVNASEVAADPGVQPSDSGVADSMGVDARSAGGADSAVAEGTAGLRISIQDVADGVRIGGILRQVEG